MIGEQDRLPRGGPWRRHARGVRAALVGTVLVLALALGWGWWAGRPPGGMAHIQGAGYDFHIDHYEFPNQKGTKPKYRTDLAQARRACDAAGKRLCTDAEWRRACMGPAGTNLFSYGPDYQHGLCNAAVALASGHSGMVNDRGEHVTLSGAKEACRSAEGVYDLVGNLEEWVLSSWQGKGAALEGGAWFTYHLYADCSGNYSRQPNYRFNPSIEIFSAGFRCCWSSSAPTEAALSRAALSKDTVGRMNRGSASNKAKPYARSDEVQVAPGIWMDRFEYPNLKGVYPAVSLTWDEASNSCRGAGKRLCTTEEWTLACAGTEGRAYPHGDHLADGACASGLRAAQPAGSHPLCSTPEGVMDLLGGVWEWSATSVGALPHVYPEGTVLRQVLGGSWVNPDGEERCQSSEGYAAIPQSQAFPELGFRCCRGHRQATTPTPLAAQGLRCPARMTSLGSFCVDTYEHPNRPGQVPVAELDFAAAQRGCLERGLHVCTSREWTRACTGGQGRAWPYGHSYKAKICNYAQTRPNALPEAVPGGGYPECVTPEGVYDLSGNLWEWTEGKAGEGELRGGGLNVSAGYGGCHARARPKPGYHNLEMGARCCATEEEVAALLGGGSGG